MYKVYQVMNGETIDSIARKINVSVDELKRLNGITNGNIMPGSYIIIPSNINSDSNTYIVKKGDNPYSIAKQYNIDYQTLLTYNGLNENDYIYPNQELMIPNEKIYITKKGDTIEFILNNLNMNYNDLKNKDIYVVEDQIIKY